MWKLLPFVPQISLNYLNVEDLLANFLLSTLCMDFFIQLTLHLVEHKLFYFQFCGKYHKVLSISWKVFLPQNSCSYLTVEVLLALSTLCMDFFIQLTLHVVDHKLFYFYFFVKF